MITDRIGLHSVTYQGRYAWPKVFNESLPLNSPYHVMHYDLPLDSTGNTIKYVVIFLLHYEELSVKQRTVHLPF